MIVNFSSYRSLLHDAAAILSRNKQLPIRLRPLCRELGIAGIKRSNLDGASALLVDASSNPKILINSAGVGTGRGADSFTPWERFLIAHELGHLVLYRNKIPCPSGTSEYWQMEALCDDFAQRLLIPDPVVNEEDSGDQKDVTECLNLALDMAKFARVPWFIAASRLADWESAVAFFRLIQHEEGEYKVVLSTLKRKQGIGQRIKPGTRLWEELSKINPTRKITLIDGARLSGFAALESIAKGAVCRTPDEIRIAIPMRASA
jgi:hypothetical protein